MTTVAAIAAAAFDAVSGAISDAVLPASLTDGETTYTGRVVLGGDTAPAGFPMAKPEGKARPAYLEGFGVVPASGWTFTAAGQTFYVTTIRDVVEAGGFTVANVISSADLLWLTADVQESITEDNGAGGESDPFWTNIAGGADVPLGMWAMSGQERYASERLEVVSKWRAVMPWMDLSETHRLVIGDRAYNIQFADNVQKRGAWLVLDLGEGVAV